MEYSFSATIMVVLIALYSGVVGISALIGIIGANVAMILFGWLQESANPPGTRPETMMPVLVRLHRRRRAVDRHRL